MISSNNKLRWVLVTGGSRGIGKGLVEHLCRSGYDVVFTYKNSPTQAEAIVDSLSNAGLVCQAVLCDGSDASQVSHIVSELIKKKGPPYGLVNNMGICQDVTLVNMEVAQWKSIISTNLDSVYHFSKQVAKAMISQQNGVIIQISSVSALHGISGQTHYATSKAGMIGFTRALAVEMSRFNVRVNAIAPGYIETELLEQLPQMRRDTLARSVPLRRIGTVADLSGWVELLLSDLGSYMTGQTLVVDGGLMA